MVKTRELAEIINEQIYDLSDADFSQQCKRELDEKGVLTLSNFLNANTLKELVEEAENGASQAYYTNSTHNVYLTKINNNFKPEHVINKQLRSEKEVTNSRKRSLAPCSQKNLLVAQKLFLLN